MGLIYKILRAEEYAAFDAAGETAGAAIDLTDGFIHFSTAAQVAETAAKHFAGETGLMVLSCEAERFGEALRWEVSRGGAEFPHLYRNLQRADIVAVHDLPLRDGQHDFSGIVPV